MHNYIKFSLLFNLRQPKFYEEVKVELPAKLSKKHHLLFSFYEINCERETPTKIERAKALSSYLGCTVGYSIACTIIIMCSGLIIILQWIPILYNGRLDLGEFNLSVIVGNPPPTYSQISSDVRLPNLTWISDHKAVFEVTLSLVSSIHPQVSMQLTILLLLVLFSVHAFMQDTCLNNFMAYFNTSFAEPTLSSPIHHLRSASVGSLVQFLHVILNSLSALLVHPSAAEGSDAVGNAAFQTMVHIVSMVEGLDLPRDKHKRTTILCSYLQYIFEAPLGQKKVSP